MINFTKMHGLGNDYIYIDRRDDKNIIAEDRIGPMVRYFCNRHFGIGADGVIFIENSRTEDFKMRIFNADGTEAEMCGNGIRCFAKLVYDEKFTTKTQISIETLAGVKNAYLGLRNLNIEEVQIDMGIPELDAKKIPVLIENQKGLVEANLKLDKEEINAICVSIGNPHAIILVKNVEALDIEKYGPMIENNPIFPNKINVEIAQIIDKGHIKIRVWERGVGETYACGTGACAVAVVCHLKGYTRRNVKVYLPGGELKIDWSEQNNKVYMTGIANKIFSGQIDF